ncbi:MAG: LrgB family protein [Pseudomonadota bacterium]
MDALKTLWVYLSASPLLMLAGTLGAYVLASTVFLRLQNPPLLNPILVSVVLLVGLLRLTGTEFEAYFEGAQFIHFLLGPATVALAFPLYRQLYLLRRYWLGILGVIALGTCVGTLSAIGITYILSSSMELLLSVAPKSVTTPVAMGISEKIGGIPSLTGSAVVLTGIVGAAVGPSLFRWCRVTSPIAKGLAMGTTAHGIGTARLMEDDVQSGAFSGLAMAISAVLLAFLLPTVLAVLELT